MLNSLLEEIKGCAICKEHLPLGPRPVLTCNESSKVVIIGQAPGTAVHKSGIPWDDQSGKNLREWMGISSETFYDTEKIAIIPMGFCYPGKGKSGDLPPCKECAIKWHAELMKQMPNVELILLIGKYAQDYYHGKAAKRNLTETAKHFDEYLPKLFVLPHPSPRNNIWQAKNEWFKLDVLPALKLIVKEII